MQPSINDMQNAHQVEFILQQVLIVSAKIEAGWKRVLWMEASSSNVQSNLACKKSSRLNDTVRQSDHEILAEGIAQMKAIQP